MANLGILRRAERAGVEAVTAADAQILGVQYHRICRRVKAVARTDCRAGGVSAVHAGHRYRALAWLAVVERDHAPAVDAPGHLVFVLARGAASVALDATLGGAEEFHTCHGRCSLCRSDLAEGNFGFLHARRRVITVASDGVGAFAEHIWVGALRIAAAQVVALEPSAEVERHPSDALADALGDQGLHLGLRVVLGSGDPDPGAVLDAALGGVGGIDLDEHVLLDLGQPLVGAALLAPPLVLPQ